MKKTVILGWLILFFTPIIWAQEKIESPVWKVGDKWVCKADSGIEITLECISDEKDLFVINRNISGGQFKGKWILSYDKKDMTCVRVTKDGKENKEERERMKKSLNFPLFLGKKWTSRYSLYSPAYRTDNDILAEFSVIGIEDVEVPAGKFKAFKVKVHLGVTVQGSQRHVSGDYYYWWAPNVRAVIKHETDKSDFWATSDLQKYELVSFDLK